MADTAIEWTRADDGTAGAVWNPTTGCDRVSPGCDHCYALTMAKRLKGMGQAKYQRDGDPRTSGPGFGLTVHEDTLPIPLRWRKPRRIFVNSMSDLFHAEVPDEHIARVFAVMAAAPQHTFQVLTKRHGRMRSLLNSGEFVGAVRKQLDVIRVRQQIAAMGPEQIAEIAEYPGYLVSDRGRVFTANGSDRCVWCDGPQPEESGARRRYCSAHCRARGQYEQKMGRWAPPADCMREMSPETGEHGHQRVPLSRDGIQAHELVHRLVLRAFDREPAPGEQGCHLDGDPTNNALPNLRWGSASENWEDRKRHGRQRSYAKLSESDVAEIRARLQSGERATAIAADHGVSDTQIRNIGSGRQWADSHSGDMPWPLPGVWLGVSAEDQHWADIRIPALLKTPAAVRWVSAEPLLNPLSLRPGQWIPPLGGGPRINLNTPWEEPGPTLDWCVVGGESGPGARRLGPGWIRHLVEECEATGTPIFVKQMGSAWARANGADPKGGKTEFWPSDLAVREYPSSPVAVGEGLTPASPLSPIREGT